MTETIEELREQVETYKRIKPTIDALNRASLLLVERVKADYNTALDAIKADTGVTRNINALCNDDSAKVRKLGRAYRTLFKESQASQKLRARGKYTERQARRQQAKVTEARASLGEVLAEVIPHGV